MNDFIVDNTRPDGLAGVFEDDGETGYLYIYKPETGEILRHLHLYDRSEEVNVTADDVRVLWSADLNKCGVVIWGKMRGIIDLKTEQEGRVWLENRKTPGIGDRNWLAGFDV